MSDYDYETEDEMLSCDHYLLISSFKNHKFYSFASLKYFPFRTKCYFHRYYYSVLHLHTSHPRGLRVTCEASQLVF